MSSKTKQILIKTSNITKTYRVWKTPSQRLLALVLDLVLNVFPNSKRIKRWLQQTYTTVEALKETSLTLRAGEALGIIGRNGAGKSTLLQMITGSLTPTSGTIERNGRIAALLELGSGFDPECTGVENVRLNAAILGLTNDEIEKKFDSILDYADIGDFVYQPVKTYSSGMRMRLAFAVAAHVEADIIIIDEALSVGDARFQMKCAKTIEGHLGRGSSLLFVSHNMNAVKQLCASAVLLNEGELLFDGDPNEVANVYSRITVGDTMEEVRAHIKKLRDDVIADSNGIYPVQEIETSREELKANVRVTESVEDLKNKLAELCVLENSHLKHAIPRLGSGVFSLSNSEFRYGGEFGNIESVEILDVKGDRKLVFTTGDVFTINMKVMAKEDIYFPIYAMTIKDVKGQEIYVCNTLYLGTKTDPILSGKSIGVKFVQQLNLMQGDYFVSLGFVTYIEDKLVVVERRYDVIKFQVLPQDKCHGIANLYSSIVTYE